jgi:hypothetical protein
MKFAQLRDIKAFTNRDAWAVGYVLYQNQPLLLHWDGHKWANKIPKHW